MIFVLPVISKSSSWEDGEQYVFVTFVATLKNNFMKILRAEILLCLYVYVVIGMSTYEICLKSIH